MFVHYDPDNEDDDCDSELEGKILDEIKGNGGCWPEFIELTDTNDKQIYISREMVSSVGECPWMEKTTQITLMGYNTLMVKQSSSEVMKALGATVYKQSEVDE